MSKTDLGDSAGAGNQKQATNFKDALIKGINKKISEKDPNPQELNFQKILSPESGQLSPNGTTIDGKLITIKRSAQSAQRGSKKQQRGLKIGQQRQVGGEKEKDYRKI